MNTFARFSALDFLSVNQYNSSSSNVSNSVDGLIHTVLVLFIKSLFVVVFHPILKKFYLKIAECLIHNDFFHFRMYYKTNQKIYQTFFKLNY